MIIGNRLICGLAGLVFALSVMAADGPAAGDWSVEQLMQVMSAVKSAKGKFVERKQMAILNTPLEMSGTLAYTAPNRLEKHTLRPKPESLVLDRDQLTIENKEKKLNRTLNLQEYPLIWALVEGIRSTLAGDLRTLSRFYRLNLEGNVNRWRLVLIPVESKVKEMLTEIRISGSDNRIDTVDVLEANGDRSTMTISGEAS